MVWSWESDPFGTDAANEDPDGDGIAFAYNLRMPGQYADGESGLNYNYFRDYDPGTGRYVESDPIGLNGGINSYRYAYNDPLEYFDDFGLAPCTELVCVYDAPQDTVVSSTLVDPGSWRLINVHVDPDRLLNEPPLTNLGKLGDVARAVRGNQLALCFFSRTRTYKEEHSIVRERHCLELCDSCSGRHLAWNSHTEVTSYERLRREREQQVQQISAVIPVIRCMEILRGLH